MKLKRILFLVLLLAGLSSSIVQAAGKATGGVNASATYPDEGNKKIYFRVSVGSTGSTAAPWNALSDADKAAIRSILIQNPNSYAMMISSFSGFTINDNHALIPGTTGSMTLSNASSDYLRLAPGASSDFAYGVILK